MTSRDNILEDLHNNPKNCRFELIDNLLRHYGFTSRTKGSHYTYSHPAHTSNVVIPFHKPIKAVYIVRALEAIDEVIEQSRSKGDE